MSANDTDSWREMLGVEMKEHGESMADVVAMAPPTLDLDRPFDAGYGKAEGRPFTLWTKRRVYFPSVYDGAEWVESVPRDPCDEVIDHVGGQ